MELAMIEKIMRKLTFSCVNIVFIIVIFKDVQNEVAGDTHRRFGMWQHCNKKLYHLGTKNCTYNESISYCNNLLQHSYLANFATYPVMVAEEIVSHCTRLKLLDEQDYWIEIQTKQHTGKCSVMKRMRGTVIIANKTCSGPAFAVCEASDVPVKPPNVTDKETKYISFPSVQYNISKRLFDYDSCVEYCANSSTNLAQNVSTDPAQLLGNILDKNESYWVNVTNVTNTVPVGTNISRTCSLLMLCPRCPNEGFVPFSLFCSREAHCICEKALTGVSKDHQWIKKIVGQQKFHVSYEKENDTDSMRTCNKTFNASLVFFPDHQWIKKTVGQQEFYVSYEKENYTNSMRTCKKTFNASLATFSNSALYFQILTKLNLKNDSFWIGALNVNGGTSTDGCLLYSETNKSISTSYCSNENFSICSLSLFNTTNDLEDKAFKEMLKEMTVDKKQTSKNKRKTTSAEDKRQSSKTFGVVSAVFLCTIILLIVMMDLSRLR